MSDLDVSIQLLKDLIKIPSYSREEAGTLDCLRNFFTRRSIPFQSVRNNIYVKNRNFQENLPNILLNSHHDTVKPNAGYNNDPFKPILEDGKLYGLGSNDAGGPLVALIVAFCHYYESDNLPFNLILAASAEEEISGAHGMELLLQHMPKIDFAIVGEPTSGKIAVSEKGLLVLDCKATGISGHAARSEGENAIYKVISDIQWIQNYNFPENSESLGPIHMNVTIINAGEQHNVIPDVCTFTVDVRTTDAYSQQETLDIISKNIAAEVTPRSMRLKPSSVPKGHILLKAANLGGFETFGSPTLSDQALMPFPSIKFGPGDSERSHTADEFIYIDQLESGIENYKKLIDIIITETTVKA